MLLEGRVVTRKKTLYLPSGGELASRLGRFFRIHFDLGEIVFQISSPKVACPKLVAVQYRERNPLAPPLGSGTVLVELLVGAFS